MQTFVVVSELRKTPLTRCRMFRKILCRDMTVTDQNCIHKQTERPGQCLLQISLPDLFVKMICLDTNQSYNISCSFVML